MDGHSSVEMVKVDVPKFDVESLLYFLGKGISQHQRHKLGQVGCFGHYVSGDSLEGTERSVGNYIFNMLD